jgi:hypothetical protein
VFGNGPVAEQLATGFNVRMNVYATVADIRRLLDRSGARKIVAITPRGAIADQRRTIVKGRVVPPADAPAISTSARAR